MDRDLSIYVSGLYSGTNPQPGVGIARSLRQGYPGAKIIGVEYSNRCSGIHWQDFDDIWLQRPWTELDLDMHAREIRNRLDDGGLWISSIDLEIAWLADVFPDGHPNLLTPPASALRRVTKPAIEAHEGLSVKIPEFISTEVTDWELHAFCRKHDWKVWLKGPYYEAVRTPTWTDLQHWRRVLSKAWATDNLFLQKHVTGYEESIMLSAFRGELLDCVHMRKRDLTELGKTWAGSALPVDEETVYELRKVIRKLNWSGGAEVEMVRDAADQMWLLEWNPRFPAWVHGSTIAGRNLPATLVEGATGIEAERTDAGTQEFTRVVIEVPVRNEFPLSPLPEPFGGGIGHSMKHPSGLIEFAQRLRDEEPKIEDSNGNGSTSAERMAPLPETYKSDLASIDIGSLKTPTNLFFENTAREIFANAARFAASACSDSIQTRNAYSIKTNPDIRLLQLAKENGFYAETISSLEVRKAVEAGFRPDEIILNGPAKWWRREELPDGKFHAVFCDSVEELERVASELATGKLQTEIAGIRLRTPNIVSRFGIPMDSPELFEVLISALRNLPRDVAFGIHFHMASSNVGVGQWRHLFRSMLQWCGSIEALSGRLVECLDIGGGWFPEDINENDGTEFRNMMSLIPEHLSGVTEVVCEPGKAIAQPTMGLAMSVLEVRRYLNGGCEVVMDGSIAELPMHFFQPHRIAARNGNGSWESLQRGDAMLFGRLCMEHDIVATDVLLPDDAKAGDVYVFCDAGAYDRSMSYAFGCG
jgi:diaminopimelate decarboxylase